MDVGGGGGDTEEKDRNVMGGAANLTALLLLSICRLLRAPAKRRVMVEERQRLDRSMGSTILIIYLSKRFCARFCGNEEENDI